VACGEDALRILTVQKAGGKRMTAGEFLAGNVLQVGQTLLSRRD
jgi:methionyl-tRNA formyltransferase